MPEKIIYFSEAKDDAYEYHCQKQLKKIDRYNKSHFIKVGTLFADYPVSELCDNDLTYGIMCIKCGHCGREFSNGILIKECK